LRDHHEELQSMGVVVALVSFGSQAQAQRWLEETSAPFPMLLDPDRAVYRAYGLQRSATKTMHPKMFILYFQLLIKGRKLRPVQGDPYQLGGDFLIDCEGIIRFARPSDNPADRPTIEELLRAADVVTQGI
jgi:alkyl hydroperoxide reductase subunit AhpC